MSQNKEIDDGGPAFPRQRVLAQVDPSSYWSDTGTPGMSLRDWFAGQALSGCLADPGVVPLETDKGSEFYDRMAKIAFAFADAMLAERAKKSS